jgi:hypothetical protein
MMVSVKQFSDILMPFSACQLGDLFVVRVAGNVAVPREIGSLEYAAFSIDRYPVINNISGSSEQGYAGDDLITNSCIRITCTELEIVEQSSSKVQPLFNKLGGIFIITDAQ